MDTITSVAGNMSDVAVGSAQTISEGIKVDAEVLKNTSTCFKEISVELNSIVTEINSLKNGSESYWQSKAGDKFVSNCQNLTKLITEFATVADTRAKTLDGIVASYDKAEETAGSTVKALSTDNIF